MKNKKIFMYIIILIIIILLILLGYLVFKNNNKKEISYNFEDYIPQEEISDEQLRNTTISLYFYNKEKSEIEEETRKIDSKKLLENPYKILLEELIKGPEEKNYLGKTINENTQINSIENINGVLHIDFSEDLISPEYLAEIEKEKIRESIYKTLIQLNEINEVKIKINGEENII